MNEQSYKNHRRYVPGYHFVLLGILLVYLVGSVYFFAKCFIHNTAHLLPALVLLSSVSFSLIYWYMRQFAIRAQDRAIRAEENLRHFALTGKLLDAKLRMGQIIALRFAPDDEFIGLAAKAAAENLSSDAIKKSIKNWRADNHRA